MGKDCAFQYAYTNLNGTKIVEDTDLITIKEAKELYNSYFEDFIEKLHTDQKPEMAIWINLDSLNNYQETLVHLDWSYETDGENLWKNETTYIEPF